MLLQFRALGVTMSWDDGFLGARASRPHNDGFLGARASRPHKAWHSLGHLPPLGSNGNGAMALLRPGRCCSRRQGDCLQHRTEAQRRPKGQDAGGDSRAPRQCRPGRAVGGVWRATSQKADVHPLGNSPMPASRAPAPGPSGSSESETGFVSGKPCPRAAGRIIRG